MTQYFIVKEDIGLRFLVRPERAFIELAQESKQFHEPWIYLPQTEHDLSVMLDDYDWNGSKIVLICRRATDEIVGVITMTSILHRSPARTFSYQKAVIGYGIFEPYAGKGYMSDALRLLTTYAFHPEGLNLHRLEADTQPHNHRSEAVLRTAGFTLEGFSRKLIKIRDTWCDHNRWAIVREDDDT